MKINYIIVEARLYNRRIFISKMIIYCYTVLEITRICEWISLNVKPNVEKRWYNTLQQCNSCPYAGMPGKEQS